MDTHKRTHARALSLSLVDSFHDKFTVQPIKKKVLGSMDSMDLIDCRDEWIQG